MTMDELFLENLDEFVNDENKVVTYKWLSRSLAVHVNQAKQMLYAFVQQQRNNKDNDAISMTYLVAGNMINPSDPDVPCHRVCIIPEEKVEAAKLKFSHITSCHIYSVQKSQLKDSNVLYSVDYDQVLENVLGCNKFSAITCRTSKVKTEKELSKMRSGGGEAYAPTAKPKTSPPTNKGSTKSKGSSIGAMFSKASQNQTSKTTEKKPEESKPEKKEVKSKPVEKKPAGGLASAFAKQAAKPKVEKKPEAPKKQSPEKQPPKKESPPPKQTSKKSKKNADDEDDRKSKRRRIKAVETSSDEESDMEVPPTPPREPSPEPEPISVDSEPEESEKVEDEEEDDNDVPARRSPSPVPQKPSSSGKKGRVQKRRAVQKTFLDEEGFMVTEKAYEYYSTDGSDAEEIAPPTKKAAPVESKPKPEQKPSKKVSPGKNTGSKQTSLMNFFKKK